MIDLGAATPDLIGSVGAIVVVAFGAWLARQLRGIGRMTSDWNGTPARPGISNGTPGVMERLYHQDEQFGAVFQRLGKQDVQLQKIDDIEHEVRFNSGHSIKDAVHRTDDAVAALTTEVKDIKNKLVDAKTQLGVDAAKVKHDLDEHNDDAAR